ncbi:ERO1-like protein alpha [Nematocida major]|uniref:ERO1-like protein alpha n=1 Tax=Nematocida major TaxID=1912982 RepID=UPI002008B9A6|nr:ERO1-like protein alpha [Nematocida major]KAH9385156.1 ERO1-like protein alpha [Nematocida major]
MERYTGYDGSIVWDAVHKIGKNDSLLPSLLSGVHCSVTIHLCSFYSEDPDNRKLFMNYRLMYKRVKPEHMKNLKFTLDLLISLLPVAIGDMERIAKGEKAAGAVAALKGSLLRNMQHSYDPYAVTAETVERCAAISGLMGCVDCMRCSVWGRVQFAGLHCALNLLRKAKGESVRISDFDIVCFANLLNRLSVSTTQYQKYISDTIIRRDEDIKRREAQGRVLNTAYSLVAAPLLQSKAALRKKV